MERRKHHFTSISFRLYFKIECEKTIIWCFSHFNERAVAVASEQSTARKNTNGATGAAHDAYKPQGETQACTSGSSIKRKVKIQLDSIKRKVKIQLEKGGK